MTQRKQIEVVPYDPEWPKIFERESLKIREALGDNCIAIHHIGSTSVPGLAAKPKIDMIAVVREPEKSIAALEAIGIQYRGEYNIPLHYGFSRRGDVDLNLHVYEEEHPEIELNLLFRDYLRKNAAERDTYAALKVGLLQDETAFEKTASPFALTNYTLRKGEFIRSVLKKAGFSRLRMLKCNDDTEWHAAKELRRKRFPVEDLEEWTFNHPEHEHVVLYRGTEIVGYAHIQLLGEAQAAVRMMVIEEAERSQFLAFIKKWLKLDFVHF